MSGDCYPPAKRRNQAVAIGLEQAYPGLLDVIAG
jgi:hypothetical protein